MSLIKLAYFVMQFILGWNSNYDLKFWIQTSYLTQTFI